DQRDTVFSEQTGVSVPILVAVIVGLCLRSGNIHILGMPTTTPLSHLLLVLRAVGYIGPPCCVHAVPTPRLKAVWTSGELSEVASVLGSSALGANLHRAIPIGCVSSMMASSRSWLALVKSLNLNARRTAYFPFWDSM